MIRMKTPQAGSLDAERGQTSDPAVSADRSAGTECAAAPSPAPDAPPGESAPDQAEKPVPAEAENAPPGNTFSSPEQTEAPDENTAAPGEPAPAQVASDAANKEVGKGAEAPGESGPRIAGESAPPGMANNPRPLRRKLLYTLMGFGLLVLAGAGYTAFEARAFLNAPAQTLDAEKKVEVEVLPGDTFGKVAVRLEKSNIIANALYFRLYAMWEGRTGSIQAGVFEFSPGWTPGEVLHHLVFGHPVLYRLTVREGLPWWEVAKLAEKNGFAAAEDFREVIHDPEFLAKHGIPFVNAEGFLFPDTYFLRRPKTMNKDAARALAERLVGTFEKKTRGLFSETGVNKDEAKLREVIILASMVEKETGIAEERGLVAGVFANRLKLNMLMQCDPTIIYGLGENFDGNLRRRDLEDDSNPYNTYRHPDLPPGPICSPGLAAITAAARPDEHDYLYFVAVKTGGGHIFNSSLSEHNKAVNKYQRNRGG